MAAAWATGMTPRMAEPELILTYAVMAAERLNLFRHGQRETAVMWPLHNIYKEVIP